MERILQRIRTPLLIVLVAMSLWQFTILMNQSQDTYRKVQAPEENAASTSLNQDPVRVIAPPRMIAHLPNGDLALLRSSSAYYQTIWSTVLKGSLKTLEHLDPKDLTVEDKASWTFAEVGIDMILPAPISLKHFCEVLQIELIGEETNLPMVNRLYISGYQNDYVILEDGENHLVYRLPVPSQAEVIYNLLEVTQNSVYYALTEIDITPYDFVATNPIYSYRQNPYVAARDSGKPITLDLDVLAGRFFDDTAMIRSFTDISNAVIYYDGLRTMRLSEEEKVFPQLELKQSAEQIGSNHQPIQAMSKELNAMQLWPQTSEILFDGVEVGTNASETYYTLVSNGRPIYMTEGNRNVLGTLQVESKGDLVTSLTITEPTLGASQRQFLSLSASYILWGVWNQWEIRFPDQTQEEMPLRDIYEGFLFNENQTQAQAVWIVEFYNGCKLFYNMMNGDYLGMQAAVTNR